MSANDNVVDIRSTFQAMISNHTGGARTHVGPVIVSLNSKYLCCTDFPDNICLT